MTGRRFLTFFFFFAAGPLPQFEGLNVDTPQTAPITEAPASPPAGAIRVPPLNPEDTNKFASLFDKSGSVNGVIPGMYTLPIDFLLSDIFGRSC